MPRLVQDRAFTHPAQCTHSSATQLLHCVPQSRSDPGYVDDVDRRRARGPGCTPQWNEEHHDIVHPAAKPEIPGAPGRLAEESRTPCLGPQKTSLVAAATRIRRTDGCIFDAGRSVNTTLAWDAGHSIQCAGSIGEIYGQPLTPAASPKKVFHCTAPPTRRGDHPFGRGDIG